MNLTATLSRNSLLRLFLVNLFFGGAVAGAVYYCAGLVFSTHTFADLMELARQDPQMQAWAREISPLLIQVQTFFYPALAGALLFWTLVQWIAVRGGIKRVVRKYGAPDPAVKEKKKPSKTADARQTDPSSGGTAPEDSKDRAQRYYLHLLSVLQRHGRLMDFFDEDLNAYEDAQIGAAVRSIHENCARVMTKTIAPKSVIDQAEGQEITVPADFDTAAIKLTGNVTGEPPFTGVLRHRGWKAGKLELPVLSATGDCRIIAPAEIEIQ